MVATDWRENEAVMRFPKAMHISISLEYVFERISERFGQWDSHATTLILFSNWTPLAVEWCSSIFTFHLVVNGDKRLAVD